MSRLRSYGKQGCKSAVDLEEATRFVEGVARVFTFCFARKRACAARALFFCGSMSSVLSRSSSDEKLPEQVH